MTFDAYLTVLTSCFTDLLTVGQPYTEVMKMDVLHRTLVDESFKSATLTFRVSSCWKLTTSLASILCISLRPTAKCRLLPMDVVVVAAAVVVAMVAVMVVVLATVVAVDPVTAPRLSIRKMSSTRITA
jgi:hypothetical protein